MRKKILLTMLVAVFTFAIVACGKKEEISPSADMGNSQDASTENKNDANSSDSSSTTEKKTYNHVFEIRAEKGKLNIDAESLQSVSTKKVDEDWWGVVVTFNKKGQKTYEKYAKKNVGEVLSIYMDGESVTECKVAKPFNTLLIPTFESEADASDFASMIKSGIK